MGIGVKVPSTSSEAPEILIKVSARTGVQKLSSANQYRNSERK